VVTRSLSLPQSTFFLFGARGTGKTTWLQHSLPRERSHFFNLLIERDYQHYLTDPHQFYLEVQAIPQSHWIVIDEIQRLPQLLNYVHQLINEGRWKFALTGSSARQLRRQGVNLLAGRALTRYMFPYLPSELGEGFKLSKALHIGLLPVALASAEPVESLFTYCETYLREEIQHEALVKNLASFSRFLRVSALMHGQVLNTLNIAREAGVARSTVQGYFDVLYDTHVAFALEAYQPRLSLRERHHPKFYWFDPGVVRALKGYRQPPTLEERGALLEGLVAQSLKAYLHYSKAFENMCYWCPTENQNQEVDFVLLRSDEAWAIEVKSSPRLRNEYLAGLKAISGLKHLKRKILLYTGSKRLFLKDEGIEVLPVEEFLRSLSIRRASHPQN